MGEIGRESGGEIGGGMGEEGLLGEEEGRGEVEKEEEERGEMGEETGGGGERGVGEAGGGGGKRDDSSCINVRSKMSASGDDSGSSCKKGNWIRKRGGRGIFLKNEEEIQICDA